MINRFFLFLGLAVLIVSCTDPIPEPEAGKNQYYVQYRAIYDAQDSVGVEGTLAALDEYLAEYPIMQDGFILKGYLLAEKGDLSAANDAFTTALELDSSRVDVYEYWIAYLLKDEANKEKVVSLLTLSRGMSTASPEMLNNEAWFNIIHTKNYQKAMELANAAVVADSSNSSFYFDRTAAVISHLLNEDSLKDLHMNHAVQKGLEDTKTLNSFFNNSLEPSELYNTL